MGGKPQKVYYTIGEASRILDVHASTLRFWEKEFDIIKPFRNARGVRFYHPEDMENLALIHYLLKAKGFTIPGAREHLKNHRAQALRQMDLVKTLQKARDFLVTLRDHL